MYVCCTLAITWTCEQTGDQGQSEYVVHWTCEGTGDQGSLYGPQCQQGQCRNYIILDLVQERSEHVKTRCCIHVFIQDLRSLHTSKLKIEYRGDPLLQPLRSYEISTLVRLFFHISSRLNMKVCNICFQHSLLTAKLCLQLALGGSRQLVNFLVRLIFVLPPVCSSVKCHWFK